ncbi:MAG: GNAT family N-acetyltransferase [Bacteroides sp.]|nr:GNAT family N-acetyltransferase [Bacteroides sp.]
MLQLRSITTRDEAWYAYAEALLHASFPPEERRNDDEQRLNADTVSHFHTDIILADDHPIGLITYWTFPSFCYIEHFATSPQERNKGYGREILQLFCRSMALPIVLEVELPDDDVSRHRTAFYQRNGFQLCDSFPYLQPPYREGDSFLPMHLMVHGMLSEATTLQCVRETIYREVYGRGMSGHPSIH